MALVTSYSIYNMTQPHMVTLWFLTASTTTGNNMTHAHTALKRHGPFVAFYFYCKIMLYGINYTYYSVKTVKICFHVPFRG